VGDRERPLQAHAAVLRGENDVGREIVDAGVDVDDVPGSRSYARRSAARLAIGLSGLLPLLKLLPAAVVYSLPASEPSLT
jgi:hypothetical protein